MHLSFILANPGPEQSFVTFCAILAGTHFPAFSNKWDPTYKMPISQHSCLGLSSAFATNPPRFLEELCSHTICFDFRGIQGRLAFLSLTRPFLTVLARTSPRETAKNQGYLCVSLGFDGQPCVSLICLLPFPQQVEEKRSEG